MSDIAIRIENLGKRYRYGGAAPISANLRSDLTEWARGIFSPRRHRAHRADAASVPPVPSVVESAASPSQVSGFKSHPSLKEIHESHLDHDPNYFWALKDINLEVRQGEVVGIIGRNGAGKSTLLKILSRITPPTTGKITYNGRIASLLEVGTGFHRELTGRENIFLNGSILGMKRAEIAKKFDEIVAFAEVEKFIDTPVKFYSSGMYVRLAFAVAAHLEPEILVVDEVLAVGDASFQKKCLEKMGDVAKQGRTILFVSHNMAAIQNLCSRGILIVDGILTDNSTTERVISNYLQSLESRAYLSLAERKDRTGEGRVRFSKITLLNDKLQPTEYGVSGQQLTIRLHYTVYPNSELRRCRASVSVHRSGMTYFLASTELVRTDELVLRGQGHIDCVIDSLPLSKSEYYLNPFLEAEGITQDYIEAATSLRVINGDFYGTGRTYHPGWEGTGVLIKHRWIW